MGSRARIAISSMALALAACGGAEPLDDMQRLQAFAAAAARTSGCMAPAVFQGLIDEGVLLERPAMGPGDQWAAPWLLVPVDPVHVRPVEYAPGLVGTPVTLTGSDGQPKAARGLYYAPGEWPAYVCRGSA